MPVIIEGIYVYMFMNIIYIKIELKILICSNKEKPLCYTDYNC